MSDEDRRVRPLQRLIHKVLGGPKDVQDRSIFHKLSRLLQELPVRLSGGDRLGHRATFFTDKLVFEQEKFFQGLLHNETASAIQRRLQWEGITTVILPIRVMNK